MFGWWTRIAVISDGMYLMLVTFCFIRLDGIMVIKCNALQVVDEYQKSFGESWRNAQEDSSQSWPYLNEALAKFQACKYLLFIILASARGVVDL